MQVDATDDLGNTSTCVEKTRPLPGPFCPSWKHLHVRGEDCSAFNCSRFLSETPPHAWRRLDNPGTIIIWFRNTSTCVEKTCEIPPPTCVCRKHLHVRGEDRWRWAWQRRKAETPPRAWRRRGLKAERAASSRNTSTCVEKTPILHNDRGKIRKHLHVRGEDPLQTTWALCMAETPPRAWRRRNHHSQTRNKGGNTSTCVEKTGQWRSPDAAAKKHLHVRGEDTNILLKNRPTTPYLVIYAPFPSSSFSTTNCNPEISHNVLSGIPIVRIS